MVRKATTIGLQATPVLTVFSAPGEFRGGGGCDARNFMICCITRDNVSPTRAEHVVILRHG